MEDITQSTKRIIKYGLLLLIFLSVSIGAFAFKYQHRHDLMIISDAKVAGTMVSVRVLTNGTVKEILHADGDIVKAGDVIAKIDVSVTDDQIEQLEKAVELAKSNYAQLQVGQMVKVPIRKPKLKTFQPQLPPSINDEPSADLAALEERKNRMELLFEMGAISKKEMESAQQAYESAKATAQPKPQPAPQPQPEIEYEIEYVEQLQPTPPEILNGAQLAIKQAELSLNVARQESQQTDIIAPVDGTIYYGLAVDSEVNAGDVVAKVGNSHELWLEAEVSESQFDKISLGKLVTYTIDGQQFTGTVIDKISPIPEEEPVDSVDDVESPPVEEIKDEINPELKDKFIVKFSMPADIEFKSNMVVDISLKI